jgi:hypothetical protein
MDWSDYEGVWKRQELPLGAGADVSDIARTFEAKSRKLRCAAAARDFAEAGAGLVVAAAYVCFWWKVGKSGWPIAIAIALVLGVSGFFLRERFRVRRKRLGPDAPLLAKVEADLAELRRQARLVRSLWWWYLGPCAGAIAVQVGIMVHRSPPWGPLRNPAVLTVFCGFFALVLWFAWEVNRAALRRRIHPRTEELEKLRLELLGKSTASPLLG